MDARPLAPARFTAPALASITPPMAKTAKGPAARTTSESPSRPNNVLTAGFEGVENTVPATTKSAPAAFSSPAGPWTDRPTIQPAGTMALTASGATESSRRCTPPASAANATSMRSLTNRRVWVPRVMLAKSAVRAFSSRVFRSRSRTWTKSTPAAIAPATCLVRRERHVSSGAPAAAQRRRRSVMRQRRQGVVTGIVANARPLCGPLREFAPFVSPHSGPAREARQKKLATSQGDPQDIKGGAPWPVRMGSLRMFVTSGHQGCSSRGFPVMNDRSCSSAPRERKRSESSASAA
jgi:hypothetical protein